MSLATPEKIRIFQRKLYRKAKAEHLGPLPWDTLAWDPMPDDMRWIQSESRMPEIGTSGSMSGDGKRAIGKASSTAPILDSTRARRVLLTAESGQQKTLPPSDVMYFRKRGRDDEFPPGEELNDGAA
jgi:hypothetical protein